MKKRTLLLIRDDKSDKQTKGRLAVLDENGAVVYSCFTLELPWRGNRQNVSCIPPGQYKVRKRTSHKYGEHLHILGVPGRTYILIHEANFVTQLRGCIAVGKSKADINGDGLRDLVESVRAKKELLKHLPDETEIEVKP
jgi:hypothetical protein